MSKIENAIRGRANKAAGAAFEMWLEGQHTLARHYGILAHIEKTEPHAKFVGGKLIYTEKGVADFVGTLDRTGRSLAVEAKSTVDCFYKREVSSKQQEHLGAVARAGGLALLVVEFRSDERPFARRFAVPWLGVPWKVLKSAESIEAKDLESDEGWLGSGEQYELPTWTGFADKDCYLSKFHAAGAPTTVVKRRTFARE